MTAQQSMKVLTTAFFGFALASALLVPEAGAQRLRPSAVPKFVDPLPIPTNTNGTLKTMPQARSHFQFSGDYYEIAERQKTQSVLSCSDSTKPLPSGCNGTTLPKTTVWAFGPAASLASSDDFHYPALPIVAKVNRHVRVKWINDLEIGGIFIQHPLLTDHLLEHWANPAGLCEHGGPTDCTGRVSGKYMGPVPTIVHMHGAHTQSYSDGIPEAWYLPKGSPPTYYSRGSDWSQICQQADTRPNTPTCTPAIIPKEDGAAVFEYPNNQPATLLFFHDHTLGITAQNVYMGLVGPYLLRGGPNDLPAGKLPAFPYELPLVIQDKSFNTDGSLFFSSEGNMIVVNGKTWPYLQVEPRRYRFRIVIGSDTRFFSLSFGDTGKTKLNFTQIGNDGGFLPKPVVLSRLDLTPGERADVVVDFKQSAGETIVLQGDGDVMQFRVGTTITGGTDTTADPTTLTLPAEAPLCPLDAQGQETACETNTREVGIFDSLLGIVSGTPPTGVPMEWDAPTTETVNCGTLGCDRAPVVEVWDIYNTTNGGDAHPIHLHEVRFEVVGRRANTSMPFTPASPGEKGFKDTVLARGGTITRVRAKFDIGGLYAWHCHIIEHEDDQMMRPLCVVDPSHPEVKCNPN